MLNEDDDRQKTVFLLIANGLLDISAHLAVHNGPPCAQADLLKLADLANAAAHECLTERHIEALRDFLTDA